MRPSLLVHGRTAFRRGAGAALLMLFLSLNTGCDGTVTWYHESGGPREVRYRVDGDETETIIRYLDEAGQEHEVRTKELPWEYAFVADPGTPLFLSAQRRWYDIRVVAGVRVDGRLHQSAVARARADAATITSTVP